MASVFGEVQAYYRRAVQLTHAQRVTRLYRKSLKTVDSWACDRGLFNYKAKEIRARFDAYKAQPANSGLVQRILREGEAELAEWTHPDMYTVPYMPGGSKFMRNPSVPLEAVFPDGVPAEYASMATKDVNNIQLPMSAQPAGMATVLIDVMKKSAE